MTHYDLEYHEPETLWMLILEIHRRDKSVAVQQVLSAGPIENLLAIHGESFIERIEAESAKGSGLRQSARRRLEKPHERRDMGSAAGCMGPKGMERNSRVNAPKVAFFDR